MKQYKYIPAHTEHVCVIRDVFFGKYFHHNGEERRAHRPAKPVWITQGISNTPADQIPSSPRASAGTKSCCSTASKLDGLIVQLQENNHLKPFEIVWRKLHSKWCFQILFTIQTFYSYILIRNSNRKFLSRLTTQSYYADKTKNFSESIDTNW